MPKEPEIKTNTRFPKHVHEMLAAISKLTGVSQNDIIVEAVKTVCDMTASEANWIVPKIVIQARAVAAYSNDPPRLQRAAAPISYLEAAHPGQAALAAEDSPPQKKKRGASR